MIKHISIGTKIILYIYFGLMIIHGVLSWKYAIFRQTTPTLVYMKFLLIPTGFLIAFFNGSFVVNNFKNLGSIIILSVCFFLMVLLKGTSLYQNICLVWCASFIVGYLLSHYALSKNKSVFFWPIAYILFPVSVYYILLHRGDFSYVNTMVTIEGYWIDNNVIMVLFALLPHVLIMKSKRYNDIAMILVMICAIISVKRTIIIASFLIELIYLYYRFRSRSNIVMKLVVLVFAVWGLFYLVRYLDASFNGGELFDRLNNTVQGNDTSGREDQYIIYFNVITNSSLFDKLFGASVIYESLTGNVHNDLLYVAYHYGFVGFVLFLTVMIKIISVVIKIVKTNCLGTEMSLACLTTLVALMVCGMFNCFIVTNSYIYMMLFFGYAIGKYELIQKQVLNYQSA